MKGNARLGMILAIFAAAGCASLAVVYSITKPSIEMQDQKALNDSLKDLFPEAASFEDISSTLASKVEGVVFEQAFLVKSAQAPLGVAVKATGSSYGGAAKLLVGVTLTRSVAGVRVLELNDTPGLGMNAKNANYFVNKAEKLTFPGQYKGKFLTDPFEVKKDIAAITAATITSRALTTIVKAAADAGAAWLKSQPATEQPASGTAVPGTPAVQAAPAVPAAPATSAAGQTKGGK
jgi:electron transport complex protein RnfG